LRIFRPNRGQNHRAKTDINKAAGTTLLAISKVLGCRVEDLLEYDSSEIDDEE